jgi:dolichol-phosphate mannosyltransferase
MPRQGFDIYLIDRKVITVLDLMDEKNSALTGQILWSGFRTDTVYYIRLARTSGKSRWTMKKKAKLFSDSVFSFSSLPISVVTGLGVISTLGAVIWAIVTIILRLTGSITVQGWTLSFIFSLFSFGVIMLTLGLLGGYLWRTFDASRNRPLYIVEEEFSRESQEQK